MKYKKIIDDDVITIGIFSDGYLEIEYDNGTNTYEYSIDESDVKKLYEELKIRYEKCPKNNRSNI